MTEEMLAAMSPSETEVLRIIWELGKGTVQQVLEQLPEDREIGYATVQTLLRRLEKKGYLKHERQGKAHVFSEATNKEEVISRTVGDFLSRLFGGDPMPLVQHLAQHGKLTQADIDQLQTLVNEEESV
jgi:BlaI family penicillinase repressor